MIGGHVYFETAAVIITLIKLGKFLEARAKGRTSEAIKKLMGLRAKTARVMRDGQEMEVPVDDVRVGDMVIVRPGEKIPVDGVVIEGRSSRRRIDADRRIAAGGEESRRPGDRRHTQQAWAVQVRGDQGRQRDRPGADHPAGGRSPGQQSAHPEAGRPGFGGLRAGRDRDCAADLRWAGISSVRRCRLTRMSTPSPAR